MKQTVIIVGVIAGVVLGALVFEPVSTNADGSNSPVAASTPRPKKKASATTRSVNSANSATPSVTATPRKFNGSGTDHGWGERSSSGTPAPTPTPRTLRNMDDISDGNYRRSGSSPEAATPVTPPAAPKPSPKKAVKKRRP